MALSRTIYQQINGLEDELEVLSLEPQLEQMLQDTLRGQQTSVGLEPGLAEQMLQQINQGVARMEGEVPAVFAGRGNLTVLACKFGADQSSRTPCAGYDEIPPEKRIR